MISANDNDFVCRKCSALRGADMMASRPGLCRVCDNYRPREHGDFAAFEAAYIKRRADKAAGLKPCSACGGVFAREVLKQNSLYCPPCYADYRAGERARAADRKRRSYRRGGAAAVVRSDAHVKAFREHVAALARKAANDNRPPRLSDAEAYRLRYRTDPDFQIKERLRRQLAKQRKRDGVSELIRGALSRDGNSPTAERLLGYAIHDLRAHLERQFTAGMNWAEFMAGRIHIDHATPQAAFDLSDDAQWRECWGLSNLRPMWANANLAKSDLLPDGRRARDLKAAA